MKANNVVWHKRCQNMIGNQKVDRATADTLLKTSLDLFDEFSDIYCDAKDTEEINQIFSTIIAKLRCLMSDRAANTKLFNKKRSIKKISLALTQL